MFLSLNDLAPVPSVTGVKTLDSIDAALAQGLGVAGPLVGSPSMNEPLRRDLTTALNLALAATKLEAGDLESLGWTEEAGALKAIGSDIETQEASIASGKPSWSDLDSAIKSIRASFATASGKVVARASSEANDLVGGVQSSISNAGLKSPMDDTDWSKVDDLVAQIQKAEARIKRLPLSKISIDGVLSRINVLYMNLDSSVYQANSAFANKSEQILVTNLGVLGRQQGRKIANWLDRNKLYVGAGVLGVAVLAWVKK